MISKRIGIFAGSFDPVHKGHVAFALEALKQAKLDEVYFLPEIQPRGKDGITHIGHRVAMLELALKPHERLRVLELPDKQFTVAKTWPRLKQKFPGSRLLLLMGSDTFDGLLDWPNSEQLLNSVSLVVAYRNATTKPKPLASTSEIYQLASPYPGVASRNIRSAIASGKPAPGSLKSVESYIAKNWLYPAI